MDKHTKYFITSAVLTFLALSTFAIFRLNYLENPLFELLFIQNLGIYFSKIIIIAVILALIFGIRGSLKARIVWMGILFELLYLSFNVFIYNFYYHYPKGPSEFEPMSTTYFDPVNIIIIILITLSVIYNFKAINIKETCLKFSEKVPLKTTAVFLLFVIMLLIGIRPFNQEGISIKQLISFMMLANNLLIASYIVVFLMLIFNKKHSYIFAPILLILFSIRWFSKIEYFIITHSYGEYRFYEDLIGFANKIIYGLMDFFGRKIIYTPSILSFLLAFIFLIYLRENDSDSIAEEILEKSKAKIKNFIRWIFIPQSTNKIIIDNYLKDLINEMNGVIYILCVKVKKSRKIAVGSLGSVFFKKGTYLYIGSGGKNLVASVERHMSDEKKIRWHIDYLLREPNVNISRVYVRKGSREDECETARSLVTGFKGVPGFGSSDCKCSSHLFFAEGDFSAIIDELGFHLYWDL